MLNKNKSEFLKELSKEYYNPERGIFGNESMNYAIHELLLSKNKENIISELGKKVWIKYDDFKKNFKNELKVYVEFLPNFIKNTYRIKNKEKFMIKIEKNKKLSTLFISARIRKEFFGECKNEDYKSVYDFFNKFRGSPKKRLSKSLEYIFDNYPDKEMKNVLNQDLFYFYIKEKLKLENLEFNNFYSIAPKFIEEFEKLTKNKKDEKLLEKLVKEDGFMKKLLIERISSFFNINHYKKYLMENKFEDDYDDYDDDEDDYDDDEDDYEDRYEEGYNVGYPDGKRDGYDEGYNDRDNNLGYNPQKDNEKDNNKKDDGDEKKENDDD